MSQKEYQKNNKFVGSFNIYLKKNNRVINICTKLQGYKNI